MEKLSAVLRRTHAWHWGLAAVVIVSLVAFRFVRVFEEERVAAEFQAAAVERIDRFQNIADQAIDRLGALGTRLDTAISLDRKRFTRLSQALAVDVAPAQALEWVPRVPEAERGAYIAGARRDGFAGFDFTERNSHGAVMPASRRSEYYPVFYVEPYAGNERALGYDLASSPAQLALLEQAAEAGRAIASGRVTVAQGNTDSYGVLVARPVYEGGNVPASVAQRRARLLGFAVAAFCIGDIVATGEAGSGPAVRLAVLDNDAATGSHLLNPPAPGIETIEGLAAGLHRSTDLKFAGRSWTVVALPAPAAFSPNRAASCAVLTLGLLIAALCAAVLRMRLARRRQHGLRATRDRPATGATGFAAAPVA